MEHYILINEAEERKRLENLTKEDLVKLCLDLLEEAEDARLEAMEEY